MTPVCHARDVAYPWYAEVQGEQLAQGDILRNCPLISLPGDLPAELLSKYVAGEAAEAPPFSVIVSEAIVMTQSCDLEAGKVDLVLVCRLHTLSEIVAADARFADPARKESIRAGRMYRYHMLHECTVPGLCREISVVDLNSAFSLPIDFARRFAGASGRRARLLPPYREHLAQAFARFYMRVGLPLDIPGFR
jgi:hypothetical protein